MLLRRRRCAAIRLFKLASSRVRVVAVTNWAHVATCSYLHASDTTRATLRGSTASFTRRVRE